VFGLSATFSSAVFALGVGLRLVLYAPVGHWSNHVGPVRVLWTALGVRLCAFLGILSLAWVSIAGQRWLVTVAVCLLALPWALLSVSSKVLTAQLSPLGEGEGMGLLNATSALTGMLGALLGGWCAATGGITSPSP
jgi:MFS family permease